MTHALPLSQYLPSEPREEQYTGETVNCLNFEKCKVAIKIDDINEEYDKVEDHYLCRYCMQPEVRFNDPVEWHA